MMENNNYSRKKDKSSKTIIILALVFSLIGGVIGSAISYALLEEKYSSLPESLDQGKAQKITIDSKANVAVAVSQKALSSVVGITSEGKVEGFFGPQKAQGTGSGIIIDEKGYILTNAHVVKIGDQVSNNLTVLLDDGTSLEGKALWVDTSIDIAIVKIEPKVKLQAATLGDSDKLQVGQTAIAIGNPINLAYQRSVTQGIISGLNRYVGQVDGGGYMTGLIQTDASINGGNSGGPLLNDKGEVIGINTVKVTSAEGLGFSIPINSIKPIIEQVIKTGDYKVVMFGIQPADVYVVQRYINRYLGTDTGVYILKIYEDSPAAKSGLKQGDIITKINNDSIQTTSALKAALYKYKVGDEVDLEVIRNGIKLTVKLTFTQYDEQNIKLDYNNSQQEDLREGRNIFDLFN